MDFLSNFDWSQFWSDLLRIGIALLLALPIAYNRERQTRIMGLRTFPLVAVASCGYILVAQTFIGESDAGAQARIVQGLLSGIGFIGGGAILKNDDRVLGTATAASIWTTGAIGAAAAYSEFEIGLVIALVNFLVLRWLTPLKESIDAKGEPQP